MKAVKFARRGMDPANPWVCTKPWPEDGCMVQCGGNGVVLTKGGIEDLVADPVAGLTKVVDAKAGAKGNHYRTAFFEAFPTKPISTFIRGEGPTIQEAEAKAWAKYEKLLACPSPHDTEDCFEKRGYTNGLGFCKECGTSHGKAFAPWEPCVECGVNSFWSEDVNGDRVCESCCKSLPLARWNTTTLMMRMGIWDKKDRWWNFTPEEVRAEYEHRKAKEETR